MHADSPLLDHCPQSLPAYLYFDSDWFAREQRAIWARNWVYVGRREGFAEGTINRLTVAGQNLIIVADAAGTLSAFYNTCRHRGAELCQAESQQLKGSLITCPYHAWAYDTSGRLISTAFATPTADFRKEDHGLFGVHLHDWNGFIYLCLADEPPAFAPDLGVAALNNWPMADLVVGHVLEKELACNWKVFWENYNECLHCPGIHPELSAMVPVYSKGIMSEAEAPDLTPDMETGPTLKDGARSWTVNGQPCGPEFPDLTPAERLNAHNFVTIYPSMFVVAHVDYVRTVSLRPLGPEKTLMRAEWLFLPDTLKAPDFDLANVTDFATTVLLQDSAACEINQRGLHAQPFTAGRLMPQEFDIHNFHKWVLAQMESRQ